MVGKGQVYAEELRQQMGERLPGSFQAMARASGFGSDEAGVTAFYKAVEAGEIRATEVFPRFAEELMKMANEGGALEKAMNSTAAAIGRFRTNVYLANKTFNESGYDKSVRSFFNASSDSIERAEPFWEALGKAAEYLGLALEVPIELFGVLSEKIPAVTAFVSENSTAFKLLAAYLVAVVKPLRKLVMLTMILPLGLAAISDLIENWNRDRTWEEWVIQIGLAVAALGVLAGVLSRILSIGRAVKNVFGGKSTPSSTGGASSTSSSATRAVGKGLGKFVGAPLAAYEVFKGIQETHGEFIRASNMSPQEWVTGGMQRDSEGNLTSPADEFLKGLRDKIDNSFRGWVENKNLETYGKAPFSPEMIASVQRSSSRETTSQFIGDVHITVESSDPLLAGTKTEEAFLSIFNREIRTASTSDLVTEK